MTRRALISVSNKEHIVEFAQALIDLNFEIISTGGTLKALQAEGILARPIEDVTNFPEILNGRVKTLHPKIHGGILAETGNDQHEELLEDHDIEKIHLVVANLYPFSEVLMQSIVTHEELVENIYIGGPSLLRAVAKNYINVFTVFFSILLPHIITSLNNTIILLHHI